MNYINSGCTIIDISFSIESRTANSQQANSQQSTVNTTVLKLFGNR
jgi:hypothetical protein